MGEPLLGVLGGMGPQATQVFYQMLLDYTDAQVDQEHVPTLIFSDAAVPDRTQAILSGDTEGVYARLLRDGRLLEQAGCTLLAITCNTSHYFADRLAADLTVPLLHMPRLAVAKAKALGYRRLAILATEGTVRTGIYQKECEKAGLESWTPEEAVQARVTALIYDVIKAGKRGRMEDFAPIHEAVQKSGCDGAVLGCTELSTFRVYHPLPEMYLDAMEVLAKEAIVSCKKRLKEEV